MKAGDTVRFVNWNGKTKTGTVEVVDAKGVRVRVSGEHVKRRLKAAECEVVG